MTYLGDDMTEPARVPVGSGARDSADTRGQVADLLGDLEQSLVEARAARDRKVTSDWYARNFPESPLNDEQRRCLVVLTAIERLYNLHPTGRSRMDGGFRPCGNGIEVRLRAGYSLSTFDNDSLTRLVLAAHRHFCRVDVSTSRGGLLRIMVHPRSPEGGLFERHPSLSDLAAAIEEHA